MRLGSLPPTALAKGEYPFRAVYRLGRRRHLCIRVNSMRFAGGCEDGQRFPECSFVAIPQTPAEMHVQRVHDKSGVTRSREGRIEILGGEAKFATAVVCPRVLAVADPRHRIDAQADASSSRTQCPKSPQGADLVEVYMHSIAHKGIKIGR